MPRVLPEDTGDSRASSACGRLVGRSRCIGASLWRGSSMIRVPWWPRISTVFSSSTMQAVEPSSLRPVRKRTLQTTTLPVSRIRAVRIPSETWARLLAGRTRRRDHQHLPPKPAPEWLDPEVLERAFGVADVVERVDPDLKLRLPRPESMVPRRRQRGETNSRMIRSTLPTDRRPATLRLGRSATRAKGRSRQQPFPAAPAPRCR